MDKLTRQAKERAAELGTPTRAWEAFRSVPMSKLKMREGASAGPLKVDSIEEWVRPECEDALLVTLNGRYAPELSRLPKGVTVVPMQEALNTYGSFLLPRWKQWLKEERCPFAVRNGAEHEGAFLLYIPPHCWVERPIQILNIVDSGANASWVHPRVHVFLGTSAEAKICYETKILGAATGVSNQVCDIHLEANARLEWIQLANEVDPSAWVLTALRANLKRDSHFLTVSTTTGAETIREDLHVNLQEPGAEARLNALWLLDEQREAHYHVTMRHRAPNCNSSQLFKGALKGMSRSSFAGMIYVDPEAQKTDAFQLNNNLLLSERAHADSEPGLEIFADDVKASHGATVGRLNHDQLLYMQSRGLSPELARGLLVQGYLSEVSDLISIGSAAKTVAEQIRRLA